MQEASNTRKLPHQEIDYFKIGKILLSRWFWIAGSVAICMLIAYVYLWYTPKTYATYGTLKLEEKKSEISDLVNVINNNDRGPSRLQSEMFVIQSRAVLINAIKDLDYHTSFYIGGRIRTTEAYPQKLLNIQMLSNDSTSLYRDLITFQPVDHDTFKLNYNFGGAKVQKKCSYDQPVTIGTTSFSIKNPGDLAKNVVYLFKFNVPDDLMGRVAGGLHLGEVAKNSNVISLQEVDSNPQFASDILNAIMTEYLNYDRTQRAQSASSMINFIDKQLDFLASEVKGSAKSIEKFKQENKIVDVTSSSTAAASRASDIGGQISLLKMQLIAIDHAKDDIIQEKNNTNINFDIQGVIDPQLSKTVGALDNLIDEKMNLRHTYLADSQPIQDIDKKILILKNNALNSINSSRQLIEQNIRFQQNQLDQVNQQFVKLPAAESDMANMKRDFDINDKVYSYLSEKKLNAQISRAAILPGATIIAQAQPNFGPISPNEHDIHRTALIFGIGIGLGLIILIRVLNPFIYDKETIESLTSIPIIGVIRKFPDNIDEDSSQILALSRPKSVFAESIRAVRTNLSFIAAEKDSKVICITSEVAGEGKSFVATNLSSTLSLIDKKVILIAADLRRSRMHKIFKTPNDIGLSNYLAYQCEPADIILHSELENLDYIVSGPVPPNPAELLHSKRMIELIDDLRKIYDIIMIDTAPIGLVSDSVPLIRLSDVNVFVIRSGRSKFYAATVPQRMASEYNLENTVIVLNAYEEDLLHSRYYTTKFTGDNYNSKYYYYSDYSGYSSSGYYVDEKKHKWWDVRRWTKR